MSNNNTTIKFDDNFLSVQHNEDRRSSLQSTSQSIELDDFDTKSVRSVLMSKMRLIKRRSQSIDETERVEGPPYHTMDLQTVSQLLRSDIQDGLPESEIETRRAQSGYNEMEGEGGVNPVSLLIKQFTNIMVVILLIAMVSITLYFPHIFILTL